VKSASTPIETEKPLLKDTDGEDVDVHIYRLMIGSLMYLTLSRPDIMFAVCACSRFQVTPKASHLHAVKRIFRKLTIEGCQFLGCKNVQQYVLFPLWSSGSKDPQNTDDDTTFEVKKPEFEGKKSESEVHVSPSSSAKTKKHDDKTKREAKGKSHVKYTPVSAVGKISTHSTNTFSAADPSNIVVRPTHRESLYVDPSQYPDDPNVPALEDITYSADEEDVGAEADFSNLETTITVSPIPKTRVHKDHLMTQIIGDLSLATQTSSMTRMDKDQVKQKPDGIFISHDKYVAKILRKFGLLDGKSASTPIDTEKPLLKDPDDSDYAGASLDRKSTTWGCQFLGCRLISWQCKKQTVVAASSTEAEYVAAASCCAQLLWI
nr:copia protein [Tanacetum cinerariifolium]